MRQILLSKPELSREAKRGHEVSRAGDSRTIRIEAFTPPGGEVRHALANLILSFNPSRQWFNMRCMEMSPVCSSISPVEFFYNRREKSHLGLRLSSANW
ncbi:hypothetical protein V8U11_06315 [Pseudomonas chlororaphis]|uniref:hypothetical protein n=1 Tax=Pseudomonas chlororaphis TaxID=587753 RepID=UPI0030CE32DB